MLLPKNFALSITKPLAKLAAKLLKVTERKYDKTSRSSFKQIMEV